MAARSGHRRPVWVRRTCLRQKFRVLRLWVSSIFLHYGLFVHHSNRPRHMEKSEGVVVPNRGDRVVPHSCADLLRGLRRFNAVSEVQNATSRLLCGVHLHFPREHCLANLDPSIKPIVRRRSSRLADLLANDLVLGWVSGKCEIGPRALGNRSILAAPFRDNTRVRLNEIKQREQFRPIAPVCLEEDAAQWFGCSGPSPFILYTYRAKTDALAAVTHVNGTARIQTVSSDSNQNLYELLVAFKARTGFGVLCNTSLNFSGRGFINKVKDLSSYALEHNLDGFVVEGRAYLVKASNAYRTYLKKPNRLSGTISLSQV